MQYNEDPANFYIQWVNYATKQGKPLSESISVRETTKILDLRKKHCDRKVKVAIQKRDCSEQAFEEFDNTKKFRRFAKLFRSWQENFKRCLFNDDKKRGALSGDIYIMPRHIGNEYQSLKVTLKTSHQPKKSRMKRLLYMILKY